MASEKNLQELFYETLKDIYFAEKKHSSDYGHAGASLSLVFGAYGLRGFERSMLSFAGIKPIRESLYGLSFANESRRRRWIEEMRSHGARGD